VLPGFQSHPLAPFDEERIRRFVLAVTKMDLVDYLAKPVFKKYINNLPYSIDTFVCPPKAEKS
jgi:hypothetical protein